MAYPRYVDFDTSKDITPADVYKINEQEVDRIEALVRKAQDRGLHVSLNLHRAPGYCINAGFREPYDLWKSKEAQDAFAFHWGMWGKRFNNVSASKISFDLLNDSAPVVGELLTQVHQYLATNFHASPKDMAASLRESPETIWRRTDCFR